ncbi:hypothetical protein DIPPA_08439 [Diplonema papillatum]|nr:hypothetical protein DIPPA_08439 [Diplonema papillatum]
MPLPRARDEVVVLEGNFAGVRGLLLHEHPSGKVTVELATGQRVKLEKGSVRLLLGSEVPRSTRRSTSPQYGGSPRSAGRSIVTPAADTFAPVLDRPASPVASSSTRAQEDAGVAELLEENRKLAERLAQAQTRAAAYYTPVRRQDSDLWDPPRTSRLPAAEELHRLPFSPPPPLVGSDREYRAAGTQVSRQGSQRSPLSTPGANIPMPAVANQPEFEPPAPYSTPTYEALHVVKEETDILTQQPSRPLDHVSFADPGSQHDRIPSRAQELYAPASPHHSTEAMPIQPEPNPHPELASGPHAYHHRHPVLVSAPNDNLLLRLQQLGTGIASLQDSMHQDAVAYSDMASRSVGLLYGE